jgi:hypothetical protein
MITVWVMKCCDRTYAGCQDRGPAPQGIEVSVSGGSDFVHEMVDAVDEETDQPISVFNANQPSGNEVMVGSIGRLSFIW